jgi:serine/threonine-protein kinase
MVRRDGLVKLLDFGLAKLSEIPRASGEDAETVTAGVAGTMAGHIVGTPKYMSPEQARGAQVDTRTDIFSAGVVLYEMVTGRHPFEGPTASHVMVAILDKQADPVSAYAPGVPEELQKILVKAMDKDREKRYQSVKDMQIDLKRLREDLHGAPEKPRRWRTWVGSAAAVNVPQYASSSNWRIPAYSTGFGL